MGHIERFVHRIDMRGVVAVCRVGVLGLITTPTKVGNPPVYRGVSAYGDPWQSSAPVVLGRLNDWLASGRPFPVWARDRGYLGPVPEAAGDLFLAEARRIGAL